MKTPPLRLHRVRLPNTCTPMAKARRHAADRLLGTGSGAAAGHAPGTTDLPDLAEDEVLWSAASGDGHGHGDTAWHHHGPNRGRPWSDERGGDGLSLALEDTPRQASAPLEVRVWPRFLRDELDSSVELFGRREAAAEAEEGGWMPPHEYLAREKGRRAATSVLEGAGRTLKGRDMSRVRDAVWSRTGFFG
ncbi:hypothetical protein Cni_G21771 [Canna indica]|uniref:Uncharacterized protein n=1 Tax=Canna indica TaxID=4628 RepID=A0AAQ3KQ64_9LILI|nr:hypothetical protein Cni_G21771 [Canna indica]